MRVRHDAAGTAYGALRRTVAGKECDGGCGWALEHDAAGLWAGVWVGSRWPLRVLKARSATPLLPPPMRQPSESSCSDVAPSQTAPDIPSFQHSHRNPTARPPAAG